MSATQSQLLGVGIKSVQRGVIAMTGGADSTKTATVTSVDVTKSELRFLGVSSAAVDGSNQARLTLTNATTVTASRNAITTYLEVSWELTEHY